MSIPYFIGAILLKKSCKNWKKIKYIKTGGRIGEGVGGGVGGGGGGVIKGGFQTFFTLWSCFSVFSIYFQMNSIEFSHKIGQ